MKFISADGIEYTVENLGELVISLHDDSYAKAPTDAQFMREMAERAEAATDATVRSNTIDNFIADLLTIGYLKEVRDEEDEKDEKAKVNAKS